jgi:hypothetical protein
MGKWKAESREWGGCLAKKYDALLLLESHLIVFFMRLEVLQVAHGSHNENF